MKCSRCNGQGYHYKHRNCNHPSWYSYERGCYDLVKCKKCEGVGYTGMAIAKDIILEIKLLDCGKASKLAEKALEYFQ